VEKQLDQLAFWKFRGLPEGVDVAGVAPFDPATRALTFFLPKMVRQPGSAIEISVDEVNLPPAAKNAVQSDRKFLYARPGVARNQPRPASVRLGRSLPFKTSGATINQDLPVFLRASYTNNFAKRSGQHVYHFQATIGATDDLALKPIMQNALSQVSFVPNLKLDIAAQRTIDNPNSIVWSMPLAYRRYFAGTYSQGSYSRPGWRFVQFQMGVEGEHAAHGQSQNVIFPVRGNIHYASRPGEWRAVFDASAGYELGWNMAESIQKLQLEYMPPPELPPTFVRTVAVENKNIRRLMGEAKLKFSKGKKVSLEGLLTARKLYRPEQMITERDVEGYFEPRPGENFFGLRRVTDEYQVLDTKFDLRRRIYSEASLIYALNDNLSVDLVYKRGVKQPSFQEVNVVTIGLSFSYGKVKE